MQWSLPFRAYSAANWLAMNAQRHFHEFGTTREQMAQIALNARRNAGRNPNAIFREPMSLDDYFAARMITTPFCLYDCDVPVDGSTAVDRVRRRARRARSTIRSRASRRSAPRSRGRPSWDQWDDMTTMPARDAAAHMWSRTDLRPDRRRRRRALRRLQLAHDGLARGARLLRARRERAVHRGRQAHRARRRAPGQHARRTVLGRALHGFGFLHEAVVQLRGEGGDRQVPGDPEVAVVANGGGPVAGAMLLTRLA